MSVSTADLLKREIDDITQRTGHYMPPYRLTNIMKAATKVMEFISKADVCMTYHEALLVLRIVSGAIKSITGETVE